jgi:hypothetical protein
MLYHAEHSDCTQPINHKPAGTIHTLRKYRRNKNIEPIQQPRSAYPTE